MQISNYRLNSINDNESIKVKASMNNGIDASKIDFIADRLQEKLGAKTDSRSFYCKVAMALDESTIDRLVTQALEKGRNPGALFNFLARKEMVHRENKSRLASMGLVP